MLALAAALAQPSVLDADRQAHAEREQHERKDPQGAIEPRLGSGTRVPRLGCWFCHRDASVSSVGTLEPAGGVLNG